MTALRGSHARGYNRTFYCVGRYTLGSWGWSPWEDSFLFSSHESTSHFLTILNADLKSPSNLVQSPPHAPRMMVLRDDG